MRISWPERQFSSKADSDGAILRLRAGGRRVHIRIGRFAIRRLNPDNAVGEIRRWIRESYLAEKYPHYL
jgi:hypothetical protein